MWTPTPKNKQVNGDWGQHSVGHLATAAASHLSVSPPGVHNSPSKQALMHEEEGELERERQMAVVADVDTPKDTNG